MNQHRASKRVDEDVILTHGAPGEEAQSSRAPFFVSPEGKHMQPEVGMSAGIHKDAPTIVRAHRSHAHRVGGNHTHLTHRKAKQNIFMSYITYVSASSDTSKHMHAIGVAALCTALVALPMVWSTTHMLDEQFVRVQAQGQSEVENAPVPEEQQARPRVTSIMADLQTFWSDMMKHLPDGTDSFTRK